MPAGKCRKKEKFDYFHWKSEDDNEALGEWLGTTGGLSMVYFKIKGSKVLDISYGYETSTIMFNMEYTPYLIIEGCDIIELKDEQFQSLVVII